MLRISPELVVIVVCCIVSVTRLLHDALSVTRVYLASGLGCLRRLPVGCPVFPEFSFCAETEIEVPEVLSMLVEFVENDTIPFSRVCGK